MDEGLSVSDFAAKIGWEGSVVEALDYGLRSTDITDQAHPLAIAWRSLEEQWELLDPYVKEVTRLLDEIEEVEEKFK